MEDKRKEVLKVLFYQRGDYYVGSMAMARVYDMLGRRYGDLSVSLEEEISKASDEAIDKLWKYLETYITYMKTNPMAKCPHCGTRVDVSRLRKEEQS